MVDWARDLPIAVVVIDSFNYSIIQSNVTILSTLTVLSLPPPLPTTHSHTHTHSYHHHTGILGLFRRMSSFFWKKSL